MGANGKEDALTKAFQGAGSIKNSTYREGVGEKRRKEFSAEGEKNDP